MSGERWGAGVDYRVAPALESVVDKLDRVAGLLEALASRPSNDVTIKCCDCLNTETMPLLDWFALPKTGCLISGRTYRVWWCQECRAKMLPEREK